MNAIMAWLLSKLPNRIIMTALRDRLNSQRQVDTKSSGLPRDLQQTDSPCLAEESNLARSMAALDIAIRSAQFDAEALLRCRMRNGGVVIGGEVPLAFEVMVALSEFVA